MKLQPVSLAYHKEGNKIYSALLPHGDDKTPGSHACDYI